MGIAQDCPGSGWMFAVGFDAPLRILDATLGEGSVFKACADVAAACGGIAQVGSLACPLGIATGLRSHPKKANIDPIVSEAGFEDVVVQSRRWLRREAPLLSDV